MVILNDQKVVVLFFN